MLILQKSGNLKSYPTHKSIDWLELEWHETNKRILHKKTRAGQDIITKFLQENQHLTQGDIIYEDAETIVAIDIQPCEAIVIKPKTMLETAAVCYEIGNKHVPLFFDNDELLTAYETPLFNLLLFLGYNVHTAIRKLLSPLKTSVAAHVHLASESLFLKIMQRTNSAE